eukprot:130506_1
MRGLATSTAGRCRSGQAPRSTRHPPWPTPLPSPCSSGGYSRGASPPNASSRSLLIGWVAAAAARAVSPIPVCTAAIKSRKWKTACPRKAAPNGSPSTATS